MKTYLLALFALFTICVVSAQETEINFFKLISWKFPDCGDACSISNYDSKIFLYFKKDGIVVEYNEYYDLDKVTLSIRKYHYFIDKNDVFTYSSEDSTRCNLVYDADYTKYKKHVTNLLYKGMNIDPIDLELFYESKKD